MKVKKFIELDREDVAWVETTYPRVSYSALFTMLLKSFRKVHTVTPHDYADHGAKELKKIIEEGLEE